MVQLRVNSRHAHGRVGGERGADPLRGHGLALEVELERDQLADLVHDARDVEATDEVAGEEHDDPHRFEIEAREARDLGILHLDDDGRAVAEGCAMNLRERGGRERALCDAREHLAERPAELALDPAAHLGERPGRHGIVEAREALDERRREDVGARTDDLAELDEEAGEVDAEIVEAAGGAFVNAGPGRRRSGAAEPRAKNEPAVGGDRRYRHRGDPEHPVQAHATQHRRNPSPPAQARQATNRLGRKRSGCGSVLADHWQVALKSSFAFGGTALVALGGENVQPAFDGVTV